MDGSSRDARPKVAASSWKGSHDEHLEVAWSLDLGEFLMNRDFWAKPIQSDRNSSGYGHTQIEKKLPHGSGFMIAFAISGVMWIGIAAVYLCVS